MTSQATMRALFGVQSDMLLDVGAPLAVSDGGIPVSPGYVFRPSLVRDMHLFWINSGDEPLDRSMMLHGPKGCGKTTIVEQWHARLNAPLSVVTGHKRMTTENLFGDWVVNDGGSLEWKDGPITSAARYGTSVLINELNACEADIVIALNDVAQAGSIITIPQTGERINPLPGFRIYATVNPAGSLYAARKELDASTRERFYHVVLDFPEEAEEMAIVQPILERGGMSPEDAKARAKLMIGVAKSVRDQSMDRSNAADALNETLSTRVLVKWARYWISLQRQPAAVHRSLERALTYSCEKPVYRSIHDHVRSKFGVPFEAQAA